MSGVQSRKRRRCSSENALTFPSGKEHSKRSLYHCNYCQRNISDSVRIKCAVCLDFDLCVECFSVGVELGSHKNTHGYRVMDFLAFPLYHPAWGADEELLLLEGIESYGIGNWASVSEHVGEKSPESVPNYLSLSHFSRLTLLQQCKLHYYQTYVEVPTAPLPSPVPELQGIPITELVKRQLCQGATQSRPSIEEPPTKVANTSKATHKETPATLSSIEKAPSEIQMPQKSPAALSGTPQPPRRRRVARASTAAATAATDSAIIAMQPGPSAGPANDMDKGGVKKSGGGGGGGRQQNAKFETSGYLRFRDEFDPEYDGDAELPIAQLDFLESDTPELVSAKIRIVQIYNQRLDERERRRELLKRMGFTDVRKLQAAEKKRTPFERRLHSALHVFERFQKPEEAEELYTGLLQEAQIRARIASLKHLRRLGARTFAAGEAIQADLKRREQVVAGRPGGRTDRQKSQIETTPSTTVLPLPSAQPQLPPPLRLARATNLQVVPWKGRRSSALDVSQMPGVSLLSEREQELCSLHRFLPSHWLLLKETMMRENERRGGALTRTAARTMFRLEPGRASRLYDHALSQGWVGSGKTVVAFGNSVDSENGTGGSNSAKQPKKDAIKSETE